MIFSKWISQHFMWCADGEYAREAEPEQPKLVASCNGSRIGTVETALQDVWLDPAGDRSAPDECRRTARRAVRCVVVDRQQQGQIWLFNTLAALIMNICIYVWNRKFE